jgi:hypothetical protein
MMVDFCWILQRDVPKKKKNTAGNQFKEVSSQSVKDAILIRMDAVSFFNMGVLWIRAQKCLLSRI